MTTASITESPNPESAHIDRMSSQEIVALINRNDKEVALAVECVLPAVAAAVDRIAAAFRNGGRLFYIGAGTSGRLGIVDASECPPTFGTDPEQVQGIIAGGPETVFRAKEGAEDDEQQGAADLLARGLTAADVVVGLTTSGRTPYTCGALRAAREIGATAIAVLCNPTGPVAEVADILINPVVGPEVITGSTRMKAGTAQKMILNMLSTGSMIRWGRVRGNRMADMTVSCNKLRDRAIRMIMLETNLDAKAAEEALDRADGKVRLAIESVQ
jgi:N-acetylmuramic acid 6-phosphate etherase